LSSVVRLFIDLAEYVDLDGAGKHRPPGLQERLQPRIAGDLPAARFKRLVDLVIDDLDELSRWSTFCRSRTCLPPNSS
jgi:hypothetical protein